MKEEIHDARCEIEWVEEHLECVGGIHKQLYIDALEK